MQRKEKQDTNKTNKQKRNCNFFLLDNKEKTNKKKKKKNLQEKKKKKEKKKKREKRRFCQFKALSKGQYQGKFQLGRSWDLSGPCEPPHFPGN